MYFDGIDLRAIGTVRHQSIYSDENDTGPDDANHDYNGVVIATDEAEGEQPVEPITSIYHRILKACAL